MLSWLRRIAVSRIAEPARKAVQTTIAAVTAFALMTLTGLPEASWAVISALFVVQPNVGSTIRTVADRLGGTVLGTLVGLACLYGIGRDGWTAAASLAAAASAVELAASVRPGLRYGHVPAGILIVAPGGTAVMASAWQHALAIGIGAATAGATVMLVFPEAAHRRLDRHLGAALRRCGRLLSAAMADLLQDGRPELGPIHAGIRRDLRLALALAGQTRRRRVGRDGGPDYDTLIHAVHRLWHTLIIVDRISTKPLPEGALAGLAATLRGLAETSCSYLNDLGQAVAEARAPPSPETLRRRLHTLNERLEGARRLPGPPAERVLSLGFALEELAGNFEEIAGLFEPVRDRRQTVAA